MASVVFSEGHKSDSEGLETGPNGWSELQGAKEEKKKGDLKILIQYKCFI